MQLADYKKCPDCGAVLKGEACLKCGYLDLSQDQTAKIPESKEIKSLFEQYITQEFDLLQTEPQQQVIKRLSIKKLFLICELAVFLTLIFISSYYYLFTNIKYFSPTQLNLSKPTVDTQSIIKQIKTTDTELTERIFDLNTDLKEGNFDKTDFAQFAGPQTNLYLEAFDFRHFVKNVLGQSTLIDQIKKDFDMSDDDLTTFFASEFVFLFPDPDFEKWGIVLKYRSDESSKFINERIATYKKLIENPKSPYAIYFVDSKKFEDQDYLLISNSKIYLDQMKEYSEGNLTNLSQDAVYTQSIKDLPQLGNMLIYKKLDTTTWKYVGEFIAKKFPEYIGLDQMLNNLNTQGLGVYQQTDGKTKVIMTNID